MGVGRKFSVQLLIHCLWIPMTSSFVVTPASSLVVIGGNVTLKCNLHSGSWGSWSVQHAHGDVCAVNSGPTLNPCAVQRRMSMQLLPSHEYHPRYGSQIFYFTLQLPDVQLSDGGLYLCSLGAETGQASLTVLGSPPFGEWNPAYVIAGDELTVTCRVSYCGSFAPRATWTDTEGREVTAGVKSRVAGSANGTLMYLESTLAVNVADGTQSVDPFTCRVSLSVPAQSQSGTVPSIYSWSSPNIVVSYCPRDLAIMSTDDVIAPGTDLTCVAKAHPVAAFRWLALAGSGFASGSDNRTLTVTSLARGKGNDGFHFLCMAYNYLSGHGGGGPCLASVEIQQYSADLQGDTRDNDDAIVDTSTASTAQAAASPEAGEHPHERNARSQPSSVSAVLSETTPSPVVSVTSSSSSTSATSASTRLSTTIVVRSTRPSKLTTTGTKPPLSSPPPFSTTVRTPLSSSTTPSTPVPYARPIEASYQSSAEEYRQKLSSYQTAITVLAVLMGVVILAVCVIGVVVIQGVISQRRTSPDYRTVERHNSMTVSVATEMSTLTNDVNGQ